MKLPRLLLTGLAMIAATTAAIAACNTIGDCPAQASAVAQGGACSDEGLQCAYNLATPTTGCGGQVSVIPTSCTCTGGAWSCPTTFSCDGGPDGAAADGGGADGSSTGSDGGS